MPASQPLPQPAILLRPIQPGDNPALARIIRTVLPEFGLEGPGCAIMDPEIDYLYENYTRPKHSYFTIEQDGEVVGGAGIAPLMGADAGVCELQKMYFLPQARGRGLGEQMIIVNLKAAQQHGYAQCYLETFSTMHAAQALYHKLGFRALEAPMGNTGHYQCTHWYVKDL